MEVSFDELGNETSNGDHSVSVPKIEDNLEIIDTGYSSLALPSTNKSNYSMSGAGSHPSSQQQLQHDVIFSEELGLAIERPPTGVSID